MSIQDITFQSENHFGYKAIANRAAELENNGLWTEACEMWARARKVAKKPENMLWAQVRADYCLTAKHRNWRAAA